MSEPRYIAPLRGRDGALARLVGRVTGGPGLTTLWGPGGVGKTRLAAEASRELRRARLRGAWIAVREDASLEETVASVLSALEVPAGFAAGEDGPERLRRWLVRERHAWVVLDEAELSPDAVRRLLDALVAEDLASHVIVTSRIPLDHPDEVLEEVPVLDAAAAAHVFRDAAPRGTYLESEAIARALDHLAGLPMAIELAAARLEVLPMEALLERLDDPLPVLRDPGREGRHGALWASLDGSWRVLPAWAQSALAQLTVFGAEASLTAAEAVVAIPSAEGSPVVLDALHLLARRCLVRPAHGDADAEPRYGLAPFVRDFVRFVAPEARGTAAERHAAWFGAQAIDRLYRWHRGDGSGRWLEREEHELRVAVRRGLAGEVRSRAALGRCGAALAFTMGGRRSVAARLSVIDEVSDAVGSREGPADHRAEGKLLEGRAVLEGRAGRPAERLETIERGLALARDHAIPELEVALLGTLGNRLYNLGRDAEGLEAYRRSAEVAAACGHRRGEVNGLVAVTLSEDWDPDWRPDRSRARLQHAVDRSPDTDHIAAANARLRLGHLLNCTGEPERALEHLEVGLEHSRAGFVLWLEAWLLQGCGQARLLLGRRAEARRDLADGVSAALDSGFLEVAADTAAHLALVDLVDGDTSGAAARLDEAAGWLRDGPDHYDAQRALVATLRAPTAARLGDDQGAEQKLQLLAGLVADPPEQAYRGLLPLARGLCGLARLLRDIVADADADPESRRRALMRDLDAIEGRHLALIHGARRWVTQLDEACQRAAASWVLGPTGFTTPAGDEVDLSRFAAPSRIFDVLARARLEEPGAIVSVETLVGAGWPDDDLTPATARNRLHVALNTLRKARLYVLERAEGGYRLDPTVPARRGASSA